MKRLIPSIIVVCIFLPGRGQAQVSHNHGSYAPPSWNYPYLPDGPYLTTTYPFAGWPGYRGADGNLVPGSWLHRQPVPVYAPLPATTECNDSATHARRTLGLGIGYYGWIGPFAASPRPKPLSVGVYAPEDPRGSMKHVKYPKGGPTTTEGMPGASPVVAPQSALLTLAVKVPQATAEVFVDGVKTTQTGTDRLFESPPLEAGKEYQYELTARWTEAGKPVERKKVVSGKPGEVVRVDLAQ